MKRIVIRINDESKYHLLTSLLEEIPFVKIEDAGVSKEDAKRMTELPKSILNPIKINNFRKFSRDELHERKTLH